VLVVPTGGGGGVSLTKKQRAVMALFVGPDGDDVSEFRILDELWPLVRNPRLVVNALVRHGLVALGDYIDEECGYALALTEAGRDYLWEMAA
jgi:hypothetical protein